MNCRKMSAVLASTAMIVLAACGNEADEGQSAAGGAESDERPTVGVSFYTRTIPLYVEMEECMREQAEERGADIEFAYSDGQASVQTNQINNFVTRDVDIIIASPGDAEALVPAYQEARDAGVPVISVANKVVDDAAEDAYVGPDLAELAYETMKRVIEGIGGEGDVVLITGPPQVAFVQLQQAGWMRAVDEAPGVEVVQTLVNPEFSTAMAVDLTNSALTGNQNIDAIVTSNDDIGLGAVQAVQERGIAPEDIYIAGWDAAEAAVTAAEEGTYDLTLSFKACSWGVTAVDTALDWLQGDRPSEHRVPIETTFVDKENVDSLTEEELR